MKVKTIEPYLVSLPVAKPKKISTRPIHSRHFLVVKITTDDGVQGYGYSFGSKIELASVKDVLAPFVVGEDVLDTEKIWHKMFTSTLLWGRRGAVLRAISAIDIALWDIKAKIFHAPLYQVLGGYKERIKVYMSSGYYCLDKSEDLDYIEKDCSIAREKGYSAYKLRIGMEPKHDFRRVEKAREILGDDVEIYVDANNAWDLKTSLAVGRELEKLGVAWFEEPLIPDDYTGLAKIAGELEIPVASGEMEATRWGFKNLIDTRAADILQPDVTVLGGITEWLKVIPIIHAGSITVVPHAYHGLHIHLACAQPGIELIEYFDPETDAGNIEEHLYVDPPRLSGGSLDCPVNPGIELNEELLEFYKIQ